MSTGASQNRICGKVHKLYPNFGIIAGDDGRHYFFLPSYLRDPHRFPVLVAEVTLVQFQPRQHPRGMRARNISVQETKGVAAHG
jgi:hypothetical protein